MENYIFQYDRIKASSGLELLKNIFLYLPLKIVNGNRCTIYGICASKKDSDAIVLKKHNEDVLFALSYSKCCGPDGAYHDIHYDVLKHESSCISAKYCIDEKAVRAEEWKTVKTTLFDMFKDLMHGFDWNLDTFIIYGNYGLDKPLYDEQERLANIIKLYLCQN